MVTTLFFKEIILQYRSLKYYSAKKLLFDFFFVFLQSQKDNSLCYYQWNQI